MKYGRTYKKIRRALKGRPRYSRRAKKARFIRRNKHFVRRLNQVAEKKIRWLANTILPGPTTAHGTPGAGWIEQLFPAQGTAGYQRIGTKIFIRYITVQWLFCNTDIAHALIGHLGMLYLQQRFTRTTASMYFDTVLFPDTHYSADFNKSYLKTQYKKMRLKVYKMEAPPNIGAGTNLSPGNWNMRLTKRFKIMKECSLNEEGVPTIPDFNWLPIYFPAPESTLTGAMVCRFSASISFTDV